MDREGTGGPDRGRLSCSNLAHGFAAAEEDQAAIMAATVANDGRRMEPYVVDKITGADLRELRTADPKEVTQAVSPEVAAQLEELMLASERNTAGGRAGIASKTGTAEHGGEGTPPHTWYVAYLPDSDVAVAVVVKNGGGMGTGATGGQVASPVGRAVLDAAGGA